ncbi:helix-turn-helix transcriptional regulator, partial [Streptomyces cinereoruber]|uniref:helix-turn-helix transcriptional regulator n=1 Tax=Streptomyces cinereoruber TaxID=67260 RepID=UPI003664976A
CPVLHFQHPPRIRRGSIFRSRSGVSFHESTTEALLAPAVTRHLIGHFARHLRPADTSRPARQNVVCALTPRELEVLQLIAEGLSNAEIAAAMFITPETVKTYVSRILAKLGLRDRVQAVVLAYRIGLVPGTP